MNWQRRRAVMAGLVLVIVAALAASAAGHGAQVRLQAQYPPTGELIDVGGYRLHLDCQGEGGPTVVFDGGAGFAPGLALAHLQTAVAADTRACVYDRAGQGWSDAGPKPRTSEAMVDELHRLLERAGEQGPYVLVGWSYGGLNVRLYAYTHSEEVAGLVLLDASHEAQFEALGGRPSGLLMAVFRAVPRLIGTGLPALVPQWVPRVDGGALPAEAVRAAQALAVISPKMAEAAVAEMAAIDLSMAQVAAGRAALGAYPLRDLPLAVVMKGQAQAMAGLALTPDEQQRRWAGLQADLAGQSTQGQLTVAEDSGHDIPYQQPDLVLVVIRDVVARAEAERAP